MGVLLNTVDGQIIKDIPAGDMQFDLVAGTIVDSAGTQTLMNTNLNYYNLTQANSLVIWTSDADSQITLGNSLTVADHALLHSINQYAYSNFRVTIPDNSTPDASNQLAFVASTDIWNGYIMSNYSHQRDQTSDTSTNTSVVYLSKHVGGYNSYYITTKNTGSNSIDLIIEFSEDGVTWIPDSGYTGSGVTIVSTAGSNFNAYASTNDHHFIRAKVNSTGAGSHSTFTIFYNFVVNA